MAQVVAALAKRVRFTLFLIALASASSAATAMADELRADVVVYGGTPAGVAAAIAAGRAGRSVIIVEAQVRVGGMISGGLCKTDIGNRATVGGISDEFFKRSLTYYSTTYGPKSAELKASHDGLFMEPKIAEQLFGQMLSETGKVKVLVRRRITSAVIEKSRVTSIKIEDVADAANTTTIAGSQFIDCSYEGDLMATAGVPYRVGREARGEYNESLAGLNAGPAAAIGTGDQRTQAYNIRGTITDRPDLRVPFPKPDNYDPARYASLKQSVIKRGFKKLEDILTFLRGDAQLACGKFDPNIQDLTGVNYAYADGSPAERKRVYALNRDYWLGYFYTLQNDADLPEEFRKNMAAWGLPKDEYPENGNVTPQLYVREGRRMLGTYVVNENDVRINRFKPDAICMGSYTIDSHPVQLITSPKGNTVEGQLSTGIEPYEIPYRSLVPTNVDNLLVVCTLATTHVAFSTLRMEPVFMMLGESAGTAADLALAADGKVQNVDTKRLQERLKKSGIPLTAPYRPIVEIGLPRGTIQAGTPVEVSIVERDVRKPIKSVVWNFDGTGRLQGEGTKASFTFPAARPYRVSARATDEDGLQTYTVTTIADAGNDAPADVTVNYTEAKATGAWNKRHGGTEFDFLTYFEHGRKLPDTVESIDAPANLAFTPDLPRAGRYFVSISAPANAMVASEIPVSLATADGTKSATLKTKQPETPFAFKPLGEFRFEAGRSCVVTIDAPKSAGIVSIGAVRWVWIGE